MSIYDSIERDSVRISWLSCCKFKLLWICRNPECENPLHETKAHCYLSICDKCAASKQYRFLNKYSQRLQKFKHLVLLTLTFGIHEDLSRDRLRSLKSQLRDFLKSMYKDALATLEFKKTPDGYNIHAHCLVLRYIHKHTISALWKAHTGKFITDVRYVYNKSYALRYVLKYISKMSETLNILDRIRYINENYKTRKLVSYGLFYNTKLDIHVLMFCSACLDGLDFMSLSPHLDIILPSPIFHVPDP